MMFNFVFCPPLCVFMMKIKNIHFASYIDSPVGSAKRLLFVITELEMQLTWLIPLMNNHFWEMGTGL